MRDVQGSRCSRFTSVAGSLVRVSRNAYGGLADTSAHPHTLRRTRQMLAGRACRDATCATGGHLQTLQSRWTATPPAPSPGPLPGLRSPGPFPDMSAQQRARVRVGNQRMGSLENSLSHAHALQPDRRERRQARPERARSLRERSSSSSTTRHLEEALVAPLPPHESSSLATRIFEPRLFFIRLVRCVASPAPSLPLPLPPLLRCASYSRASLPS